MTDNVYIKSTLTTIDNELGIMYQQFSTNELLKRYGYYFLHQLYLNAYMHVNIKNLMAASDTTMD